jgi:hypothetical protein
MGKGCFDKIRKEEHNIMNFNITAFLFTIGCCFLSLIIAGVGGNKAGRDWLASLNHPDNSFMPKVMQILGFLFYDSFGYVLYHMIANGYVSLTILVATVILVNGITALVLYKTKRFKLFLGICLVIPILLGTIIFSLVQKNLLLTIIPTAYFLWLIYDFSYFYRLWKLNE